MQKHPHLRFNPTSQNTHALSFLSRFIAGMQPASKQSPALNHVPDGVYVFMNSISNEVGKSALQIHFLKKKKKKKNEPWFGSC